MIRARVYSAYRVHLPYLHLAPLPWRGLFFSEGEVSATTYLVRGWRVVSRHEEGALDRPEEPFGTAK